MTKRRIVIRPGRYEDMAETVNLLAQGIREAEVPMPELQFPHCYHWFISAVAEGLVFVAECNGRIVGGLVGGCTYWPWDALQKQPMLSAPAWYVDPAFRRGGTARGLLKKLEERALEKDAHVMIEINNGVMADQKDRFMTISGYSRVGGQYWKRP